MAKKDKQTDAPSVQRDDALFETLGKNKKRKRRKATYVLITSQFSFGGGRRPTK